MKSAMASTSWKEMLGDEMQQPYFRDLMAFLREEKKHHTIYPPRTLTFNAFEQCAFDNVKVVIVGQDPYHGPGQANGLCFSVNDNVPPPPSLMNIFKEIQSDLGISIPATGNLERWARQGVLLLNAVLTVRAKSPGSHRNQGWERFTDFVIHMLSEHKSGLVFVLWGRYAQEKGAVIDRQKHLVLESAHPSPFSASNFFGNRHFSRANEYLRSKDLDIIDW